MKKEGITKDKALLAWSQFLEFKTVFVITGQPPGKVSRPTDSGEGQSPQLVQFTPGDRVKFPALLDLCNSLLLFRSSAAMVKSDLGHSVAQNSPSTPERRWRPGRMSTLASERRENNLV